MVGRQPLSWKEISTDSRRPFVRTPCHRILDGLALRYVPDKDRLVGDYYHAVERQTFDVEFVSQKEVMQSTAKEENE